MLAISLTIVIIATSITKHSTFNVTSPTSPTSIANNPAPTTPHAIETTTTY